MGKRYPELSESGPLSDSDILAVYQGASPLRRTTAAVFGDYLVKTLTGYIQAGTGAIARTVQSVLRETIRVTDFGADKTGAADSSSAFTAALTYAATLNPVGRVVVPDGRYLLNTTVSLSADGQSLCGAWRGNVTIIPGMTDGTACIRVPAGVDQWEISNLFISGAGVVSTFTAGTTDAQNCLGIEAWSTGSPFITRFKMSEVRTRFCAKGIRLGGFSGDAYGLRTDYCVLGFEGTLLNDTFLNLRTEACRQDMVITDSDGLNIARLSCQGSVANEVSSTIDDCRGLVMGAPYWESAAGFGRATPFLVIGGTTECTSVSVTGAMIGGSSGFASGVWPIVLDRVNGRRFEGHVADGSQGLGVQTTANTRNISVMLTPSNGFNRDDSKVMDAAINYFPNSQFEAGMKGWSAVSAVRATLSLDTADVRRGQYALKVLCAAGQSQNHGQFSLPTNIVTALRGKTVRLMVTITVPPGQTLPAGVYIDSNNGVTTVSSPDVSTRINAGTTTFASGEVTVQADATSITVRVYANNSGTNAAGTEYVLAQSISILDARVDLERQIKGEYRDSDILPKFIDGRVQYYDSAVPADADMTYALGDVVWTASPSPGSPAMQVCTTAGAGGTAVFTPTSVLPGLTDRVDQDITLTAGSSRPIQRYNASSPLTADRTVTLSTTGAWEGATFRIVRPSAGAFNLNVGTGPLKALAANQWCDVSYTGSTWVLTAFGSL